ncbi:hypothetical protein HY502_01565 [Candidatus Woesebacteria bacterium]|nr:hypothetical protein [Candidatus Woesebacteria bacterium]
MLRRVFNKENIAVLSTILGFTLVVPTFILFRSKDEYVRFWAAQSLTFFILVLLVDWITLLVRGFNFLPSLIFIITAVVWTTMVYKSWLGITWKIPLVGTLASRVQKQRGSRP